LCFGDDTFEETCGRNRFSMTITIALISKIEKPLDEAAHPLRNKQLRIVPARARREVLAEELYDLHEMSLALEEG
jgi:hypothetical protein